MTYDKRLNCFAVLILSLFVWMLFARPVFSSDHLDNDDYHASLPERSVTMAAEYPSVTVPLGETVDMDLVFHNRGRSDENVSVSVIDKPENWKVEIKTYRYEVGGIHVPSVEDKTLTLKMEPGKNTVTGVYSVRIEAQTRDGAFKMDETVTVTVKEKVEDAEKDEGVGMTTSYPVLRGPSDVKFEFSMEVENKLEEDAVFDLFAKGPEGWDINFKPAYESKFISSLRIKGGQSQTVAVEVEPTPMAQAGEYPVDVKVLSPSAKAEGRLTVILTGTYKLEVGTPTGLLSLDARQGKPANMSIYVKNTGSAVNNHIEFMSFKPENWEVNFRPERIDTLEPGDLKQVEVTFLPNEDALVGDYSVSVRVEGEKAEEPIEFRVTVKASAAWAWIGIGIIVLVIFGLTVMFRKLGRR